MTRLLFYPYDFEYKVEEDSNGNLHTYVYSYGRDTNGKKICVVHEHVPIFYATTKGVAKSKFEEKLKGLEVSTKSYKAKVLSFGKVTKELLGKSQEFYKISANYPKAVPALAKEIESWGVTCYERDILFVHRYLRDLQITPMTLIEAQGEFTEDAHLRIPVFQASKLTQKDVNDSGRYNILAVDIETYAKKREINPEKNPILMIGLYGKKRSKTYRKVFTWKKFKHAQTYIEQFTTEKEMLEAFVTFVKKLSPDIITGYFTDGFDFPYISTRARLLDVKLDLGVRGENLFARKRQGGRPAETKIVGTLHLDVFKFVRYIFGQNLKTDSFKLDNVAHELLGSKKHVVNLEELAPSWDSNNAAKLEDFCKYNLEDAHLTFDLCTLLLFDIIEFTKTVGLPAFDVSRMRFSRLVESYILRRAIERTVLAPNKPDDDEIRERMNESIQGAFVYSPKPGLYKDVVVFDFRSLYPTIISSHNLSPESFKATGGKKISVPERKQYWFSDTPAFLPEILADIITKRSKIKQEIKEHKKKGKKTDYLEARSYAFKILANSFYGYLAFYGARWYSFESAASTTAYARNYIKQTIAKAKKEKFEVLYGDTDSVFFVLGEKKEKDALNFMKKINKTLPGLMELEYEGYFPRALFVAIKGTTKGAKKKYALMDAKGNLKVTGFAAVRRNWSEIGKEIQTKVLDLVLSDKKDEAIVYVQKMIKKLLSGRIAKEKLIIKTKLTRDLSKYKAIGPHVKVAQKMQEAGYRVGAGTIISYVVGKGKGIIRERAQIPIDIQEGEYDAQYYLTHQVLPAIQAIFDVFGVDEDELLGKGAQKGLVGFM